MTRRLSNEALNAIFAQETDKVFYQMLTLTPRDKDFEPVYVFNSSETENGEPKIIPHNGHEFIAFPFKINIPGEGKDASTELTLSIANVDRSLTETIRKLVKPIDITLEVVLADHPDIVEAGPWYMTMSAVTVDALQIEGVLTVDRFLDEPFTADRMDATIFPALF